MNEKIRAADLQIALQFRSAPPTLLPGFTLRKTLPQLNQIKRGFWFVLLKKNAKALLDACIKIGNVIFSDAFAGHSL